MVDFATLSLSADTRGLEKGEIALNRLAKSAVRTEAATDKMAAGTKRLSKSAKDMGTASVAANRSVSTLFASLGNSHRLRMSAVQFGQVTQQMAAGTNAARAFAIQLPDLLLPFGTFGALAGVAAGAMAPMITRMFEAKDAAKQLENNLEALSDAMSNVDSAQAVLTGDFSQLIQQYGRFAGAAREVIAVQREIASLEAQDALSKTIEAISTQFGTFKNVVDETGQVIRDNYGQTLRNLQGELDISAHQAVALARALEAVGNAQGVDEQRRAIRGASEQLEIAAANSREADLATRELRKTFLDTELAAARLAGIDIASNIGAGADQAARLKTELAAALALHNSIAAAQSREYSGRGGDPRDFIEGGSRAAYEQSLAYESVDEVIKKLTRSTKKQGSAAKSASTSTIAALKREIAQRQALLSVTGKERQHLEAVYDVQRRLGKEASKLSKTQINSLAGQVVELENTEAAMQDVLGLQTQWSEQITRTAFEGGNLGDVIKGMLRDIALQFANAKVILPVVASVTGVLGLGGLGALGGNGGVAQAALGGGGGGGILQNALGFAANGAGTGGGLLSPILGSLGSNLLAGPGAATLGSGFLGGLGSTISSTLGAGGGLGGLFSIGANAGAVGGGLLATAGAALPLAGLAIGAFALGKKLFGRELDRSGIQGQITASGLDGREYEHFAGGTFRSDKTEFDDLDSDFVRAIDRQIRPQVKSIRRNAGVLNLSTRRLGGFRGGKFQFNTIGMSQEEIQRRMSVQIERATNSMAKLVLGTQKFRRSGERAYQTLNRLATDLTGVNELFDQMGKKAFNANLKGAHRASDLVRRFGGADAMATALDGYYTTFFSEEERRINTLKFLRGEMRELGLAMPKSREGFRDLVEGMKLSTKRGRKLYTELVKLSDAFSFALPAEQIDQAANQAANQIAALWESIASGLRALLDDILNTNLTPASGSQVLAANRMRFQTAADLAAAGDTDAAQQVAGYARAYLQSLRANAASEEAYRRSASRVLAQVSGLVDLANLSAGVIPGFAYGGSHPGGIRIVGENGPEAEFTGPARYMSHTQTKAMMSGGNNQALERKLDALVSELSAMRAENRQLKLKMLQYARKDSRILQSWDLNGQPAERTT